MGAGWQARGAGGIRGAGQVLSKGIDIILEERLPETVAHVERWMADVSVNPARRLAVISQDHGVFKGVGRSGEKRVEGGAGGGELAMRQSWSMGDLSYRLKGLMFSGRWDVRRGLSGKRRMRMEEGSRVSLPRHR